MRTEWVITAVKRYAHDFRRWNSDEKVVKTELSRES